jgi:hypothetical protein
MEQEIAFFAEQPEAVADLPRNLHRGIHRSLRRRPRRREHSQRSDKQRACDYRAEVNSDHDAFDVTVGAEIREQTGQMAQKPRESSRDGPLERDDLSSNRHPALALCLSMIFSENRYPLFRIML